MKSSGGMMLGHQSVLRTFARSSFVAAALAASALALSACVAPAVGGPQSSESGQQNSDALPTATVPAPDGGSVDQVIPEATTPSTVQVALDAPAEVGDGVNVSVTEVAKVDVTALTPGEIAGPAVAVTLTVRNDSSQIIDLSTAMVSVTSSEGFYGQPTTSEPASPFNSAVSSGATATGTYVFGLPADQRDSLTVHFEYIAGAPVALFIGQVK